MRGFSSSYPPVHQLLMRKLMILRRLWRHMIDHTVDSAMYEYAKLRLLEVKTGTAGPIEDTEMVLCEINTKKTKTNRRQTSPPHPPETATTQNKINIKVKLTHSAEIAVENKTTVITRAERHRAISCRSQTNKRLAAVLSGCVYDLNK
ncbi:hypothetical protein JOB18_040989 [Solea senegalensis]|uniref:Uncharacterized protein n=1 Tax=Solea senegalensis TaxID=28829 RepID=A0AAV6SFQ2_SOLSE|nr:hypothetical protein JOB18_040989 [Solea senegalensis]